MVENLQIINRQEVLGKDFKMYGDYDNPLFLAKDVAEWIDYSKTGGGYYNVNMMLKTVDDDEKVTTINAGSGGKTTFLTEDGLYEVLMQSRKPIARAFKKEVKQILKSVRKHGAYIKEELLDELLKSKQTANEYFKLLKTEQEKYKTEQEARRATQKKYETEQAKRKATENQYKNEHKNLLQANKQIGEMDALIIEKNGLIEVEHPKAVYHDEILMCKNAIPVTVIAKDYGMTATAFNRLLYAFGIQYKIGDTWVLYSEYANEGYTATRTFLKSEDNTAKVYTVWTQKGRKFIVELLKEHGYLIQNQRKRRGRKAK